MDPLLKTNWTVKDLPLADRPRERFHTLGAAAMLLAHNHPSGDPTPSPQDLELTHRMMEAGRLLGIPIGDHFIVGNGEPLSLLACGWMEEKRDADPLLPA